MYLVRLGKLWFFIACGLFAAFVANQNTGEVTINFSPVVKFPVVMPAYKALFSAFFVGVTVTMIFVGTEYYRKSLEVFRLRRKLRKGRGGVDAEGQPAEIQDKETDSDAIPLSRIEQSLLTFRD